MLAVFFNATPAVQAASAAATLTVNTWLDKVGNDGDCSLREVMQHVFDNSPNDCQLAPGGNTTIKFSVSGAIIISNSVDGGQLPNIINTVMLMGPITLDLGKADQIVLDVASNGRLNLVNMTIKNAKWTALDSRGEINTASVTFENNGAGGCSRRIRNCAWTSRGSFTTERDGTRECVLPDRRTHLWRQQGQGRARRAAAPPGLRSDASATCD